MSKAIFSWEGLNSDVPVLRIHGKKDAVIPYPPTDVDHTIDGGHLIVMTHPLECIQPIKEKQYASSE